MPQSKPFRVAFIPTQNAGVNYYRMAAWAFEMRKYRNVQAAMFAFQYTLNDPHPWQGDIVNNGNVRREIDSLCEIADVVVWHPVHYDHTFDFFMEMRSKHDKPFLVETDDNFIDVPQWNEAFHSYGPNSHNRKIAMDCLKMADGIVVSTPYLKETYSPFNESIDVVENSLDFKGDSKFVGWDTVSVKKHSGVRLGWIGGRSHFQDLMMLAPILREFLLKHPEISLTLVNSAVKLSCDALKIKYPFEGLSNVRYADRSVPINRYAGFMSSYGFDIGLAPLVDCNFNRSKSNLRWLEYSALKIPTIATEIAHFKQSIEPGRTGLLVRNNDPQEWLDALEVLGTSDVSRGTMGREAYKRVKKDFNIKNTTAHYLRRLKAVANFGSIQEIAEESEMAEAV